MSRYSPYITKPPKGWDQTITQLNTTIRLFLVSTVGPTVFILKSDDMTDVTFKVFIGERQMCSCGGGEARGKLCFHILFVMIKVLRVPSDNPISWQLSLVDSEVESVLSGEVGRRGRSINGDSREKNQNTRNNFLRKGQGDRLRQKKNQSMKNVQEGVGTVKSTEERNGAYCATRKELDEDNICCICQDEMTMEDLEENTLCFCESQCGTNFHTRCFRMYATYNRSEKKVVACPICRSKWTKIPDPPPPPKQKKRFTKNSLFHGKKIHCQECNVLLLSNIYRCASCNIQPSYDLCKRCFENDICSAPHQECIFVKADMKVVNSTVQWQVAQRYPSLTSMQRINNDRLQYREFDAADYDTLLSLDNEKIPSLHNHLVQSLASVKMGDGMLCSICNASCSSLEKLRNLPCRSAKHVAHEACIIGLLIETQASRTYGNVGAQCPTCNDKSWLFPSLVDDPIASKLAKNRATSTRRDTGGICRESKSSIGGTFLKSSSYKDADLCILGSGRHFSQDKVPKRHTMNSIMDRHEISGRKKGLSRSISKRPEKSSKDNLSLRDVKKSISIIGHRSSQNQKLN